MDLFLKMNELSNGKKKKKKKGKDSFRQRKYVRR